jgi:uncharacterized protein with von Willebrand factor type A (vWA) domain
MDTEDIADRNVEQLGYVRNALGRRSQPGSRPDGGMAPNNLPDMEQLLNQIMSHDVDLRNEIGRLKDQLATEQDARAHLEKIIRQVASLIVNGSKDA